MVAWIEVVGLLVLCKNAFRIFLRLQSGGIFLSLPVFLSAVVSFPLTFEPQIRIMWSNVALLKKA